MRILKKFIIFSIVIFFGCDGGGVATATNTDSTNYYSITAVDGYIKDAVVVDESNQTAVYDKNGVYLFKNKPIGIIKLSGGILEDSNLSFDINLTADENSLVISPITTFLRGDYILSSVISKALDLNDSSRLLSDYVKNNDIEVAKFSQLCYILLKDENLTNSYKQKIVYSNPSSDELFFIAKEEINQTKDDNEKILLNLLIDKILNYDKNVSTLELDLQEYKQVLTSSVNQSYIFKTNITKSLELFDDGYYQIGIEQNFTKEGDIVKDNYLNIYWQDSPNGYLYSYYEAVNYCNNLDLNGTGWRLPNLFELTTIVDINKSFNAINPIFSNTNDGFYWSKSVYENDQYYYFGIEFATGLDVKYSINSLGYVRCVKGEEKEYEPTTILEGDLLLDLSNKKMWFIQEDGAKTYQEALNYCHELIYNNYDDWRVPNYNELNSIKNSSIFTNSRYWSSSYYNYNTDKIWCLSDIKQFTLDDKTNYNFVKCVRDIK